VANPCCSKKRCFACPLGIFPQHKTLRAKTGPTTSPRTRQHPISRPLSPTRPRMKSHRRTSPSIQNGGGLALPRHPSTGRCTHRVAATPTMGRLNQLCEPDQRRSQWISSHRPIRRPISPSGTQADFAIALGAATAFTVSGPVFGFVLAAKDRKRGKAVCRLNPVLPEGADNFCPTGSVIATTERKEIADMPV
jgi:hypothetical protein